MDEAVQECRAVLEDHLRVLGPNHPETLRTRKELARCLGKNRQSRRGRPLSRCVHYDWVEGFTGDRGWRPAAKSRESLQWTSSCARTRWGYCGPPHNKSAAARHRASSTGRWAWAKPSAASRRNATANDGSPSARRTLARASQTAAAHGPPCHIPATRSAPARWRRAQARSPGLVHSSWLNQCEIYFSVIQRKVLTPNDFVDLDEVEQRLLAFERRYEAAATPFEWKFTKQDLADLMKRLAAEPQRQAA